MGKFVANEQRFAIRSRLVAFQTAYPRPIFQRLYPQKARAIR